MRKHLTKVVFKFAGKGTTFQGGFSSPALAQEQINQVNQANNGWSAHLLESK